MSNKQIIVTAVCLLCLLMVAAANTHMGQICGRLIDKDTKEPVVGASVMVVGTKLGALSDPNGEYVIAHVPPGTYIVRMSSVDYGTVEVKDVVVKVDLTTEVSQALQKKVTELPKAFTCIAGAADPVQKYETSNQVSIAPQTMVKKPVQNADQLLTQVAGVQTNASGQVFIRGGRAGDVSGIVNGVPANDPLGGSGAAYVAPSLPCRLQVRGWHTAYDGEESKVPRVGCFNYWGIWGPSNGGTAIVNGQPFDAMFFKYYGTNPFIDTEDDHLSTFAIDIDDASYIMTRSHLERGVVPRDEAVRAEEFINHFKYEYPSPKSEPFSINLEGAPSRFGTTNVWLLQIGIQGFNIPPAQRKPANLVFVVDVSGSMGIESRLGLVRRALCLLVDQLTEEDRVGIVIYGSYGQVLLRPTSVKERQLLLSAIENLRPSGSTNAEEGLRLGYTMAREMFDKKKLNRIILCSDGVANVGVTGADGLLEQIKESAKMGITLTTVGFGMDNYNDILMEQLGDKGNGHYAYVDDLQEAQRVFVDNLTGTLQVIARDVKIQVDFDPEVVRSYRLIGYENRDVADEDFRNDTVDGGEIGSGHQVTALYEVKLHEKLTTTPVGKVYVRYKDADLTTVREVNRVIASEVFAPSFHMTSTNFRLAAAAAQFGEILRKSYWAKGEKLSEVLALASEVYHEKHGADVLEFMNMIQRADDLSQPLAKK